RVLAVPGAACEDVRAALGLAIAVAIDATVLTATNIADVPAPAAPVIAPAAPIAQPPPAAGAPPGTPIATAPPAVGTPTAQLPASPVVPPRAPIAKPATATARGAAPGSRNTSGRATLPPRSLPPSRPYRAPRITVRAEGGIGVDILTSPTFVGGIAAAFA